MVLVITVEDFIMHKCKTKDCTTQIEDFYIYCSIECACYDGACSVRNIKTKKEKNGKQEME